MTGLGDVSFIHCQVVENFEVEVGMGLGDWIG